MRIAFLTTEYVTETNFDGGLANYLYRIATTLSQRGHEVEIFTLSSQNHTIENNNITVHKIKVPVFLNRLLNACTFYRLMKASHALLLSYLLRQRLLQRHYVKKFDIVQASSYLGCGLFSALRFPIPLIIRASSYEPLCREHYKIPLNLDQRVLEWMESKTMKKSAGVYAPSENLRNILQQELNIKVAAIRPPFWIEEEEYDDYLYQNRLTGKKYFIFVGTIGLLKGCETIGRILPKILTKYPDLNFVFIGKNNRSGLGTPMLEHILSKVAPGNQKQIIYLGVLKHFQLYPILQNALGVVLPSLADNLPNVLLESLGLGKIVVGTVGTSFDELIENKKSGLLVRPDNETELYDALNYVWNMDDTEIQRMEGEAKQKLKKLAPDIACQAVENFYEEHIQTGLYHE